MKEGTKKATFEGGPLDGTSREVESGATTYRHEQPPRPEDIRQGEIPIGFFPPFHEYIYEESPEGSGHFVLKDQLPHSR